MRGFLMSLVVAATTTLFPMLALADNQQTAELIAANLKSSGQLNGYKIGVKFQNGTAWLKGQVGDRQQMSAALTVTARTWGVKRVVNQLSVQTPQRASEASKPAAEPVAKPMIVEQPKTDTRLQIADAKKKDAETEKADAEPVAKPVAQPTAPLPLNSATSLSMSSRPIVPATGAVAPEKLRQTLLAPSGINEPRLASVVSRQKAAVVDEKKPLPVKKMPLETTRSLETVIAVNAMQSNSLKQAVPTAMPMQRVPISQATAYPSARAPAVQQAAKPNVLMAPLAPLAVPAAMVQKLSQRPIPVAYMQGAVEPGAPMPMYTHPVASGVAPARYDQPHMPNHAWPSYSAYPNYAGLTYPRQYSPTAWPFIGPFYPYPQVPLGWRKVTLEWDDGWWMLDFKNTPSCCFR